MRRTVSTVIPGAGLGSRMGLDKPKLLLDVAGMSLLERHIRIASEIGRVAVVAGFKAQAVVEKVRSINPDALVVINRNYARSGTAGSVKLACKYLPPGDVMVLDGDVLFERRSIDEALSVGSSCLGIGPVQSAEPVFAHLSQDEQKVVELSQEKSSEFEWSGLAVLSRDEITDFGNQHMFSSINRKLPKRAVRVVWHEIDFPEDYTSAEEWARKHG